MTAYVLNFAYLALLIAAFPYFAWQSYRKGKYREGFAAKLWGQAPPRTGLAPCVWMHAVSVGEVNLLRSLVDRLKERRPDCDLVISTTTMTGYALANARFPELTVFYCPLDFSWAVRRAMQRVRPNVLVLAELELWPNLIRAAGERGAAVAVVNGRLSEKSFRGYRRIDWFFRRVLAQLDLVVAQNETYAGRFLDLGADPDRLYVSGSLKFDEAQTNRANPATESLRRLAGFEADAPIFLAGSTQHPEEQAALGAYLALRESHPRLRLILVPRHPDRFDEVAELLAAAPVAWRRRSQLNSPPGAAQGESSAPVLLVDVVGELGAWWGMANVAFVGGSFGKRGGQNMVEPAAYGAAVSFGPNTWNFRDIAESLLAAGGAVVVRDEEEMTRFVRRAVEDPAWAAELGRRAQALVESQLGAADRTVDLLEGLLDRPFTLRALAA
jgi:3-deoxy-D-manno-octulosonic-acid transferase